MATLNINGLKSLTKWNRLIEWMKKQNPSFCCLQETHLTFKDRYCFKVKGQKKDEKQMEPVNKQVTITISDKIDLNLKLVRRDKEGHFILIKGMFNQEELQS